MKDGDGFADGLILGTADGTAWQTYRPSVLGVAGIQGDFSIDSPRFDPSFPEYQRGRWIYSAGLIRGYMQLGFVGTFSGSGFQPGTGSYLFELPVPARRPDPTLPCVIGTGMVYFSFTTYPINVTCTAIIADDGFKLPYVGATGTTQVAAPENYLQLQAPYAVRQGSGTLTGTATTNIAHNLNPLDTSKINVAETQITPTSVSAANQIEPLILVPTAGISGTANFDLKGQAGFGAGTVTFEYKTEQHVLTRRLGNTAGVEGYSTANAPTSVPMVGTYHPLDMNQTSSVGPFANMFIAFRYEPA